MSGVSLQMARILAWSLVFGVLFVFVNLSPAQAECSNKVTMISAALSRLHDFEETTDADQIMRDSDHLSHLATELRVEDCIGLSHENEILVNIIERASLDIGSSEDYVADMSRIDVRFWPLAVQADESIHSSVNVPCKCYARYLAVQKLTLSVLSLRETISGSSSDRVDAAASDYWHFLNSKANMLSQVQLGSIDEPKEELEQRLRHMNADLQKWCSMAIGMKVNPPTNCKFPVGQTLPVPSGALLPSDDHPNVMTSS
ncbi:MAG TPA: hypothetical protein VGZ00_05740 [Candidatus Baltobacteraceae bacterium]|nr:hypothetical protein [Candidatus Baltobacteraceae bacterium]